MRDGVGDQFNFLDQGLNIVDDWSAPVGNACVATAVPAETLAEGDVYIERYRLIGRKGAKPVAIVVWSYIGTEIHGSRIARITGQATFIFVNQIGSLRVTIRVAIVFQIASGVGAAGHSYKFARSRP